MTKTLDMKLHHFGILVQDIESSSRDYVENFGYEVRSAIIHDPLQAAMVQFLALPSENTYLELVAPDAPGSFLQNTLKGAPGLNHLCFSTTAIKEQLHCLSSKGAMILRDPVPAVAFRGLRIAWLMNRHYTLIELVERGTNGELDFPLVAG